MKSKHLGDVQKQISEISTSRVLPNRGLVQIPAKWYPKLQKAWDDAAKNMAEKLQMQRMTCTSEMSQGPSRRRYP